MNDSVRSPENIADRQAFGTNKRAEDSAKIDLLLVDDDEEIRSLMARRFRRHGVEVQEASDAAQALLRAENRLFDVAIIDMMLPGMNGLELLAKLKRVQEDCQIVMLTAQGTIETAVEAMKLGAFDYLRKPFPLDKLAAITQRAFERRQLQKENQQLKVAMKRDRPTHEMVGQSVAIKEIFRLIERAGPTDKAILIQGESGTGKELVARALHHASGRADKPLVAINCAALPETLLESELFGHEKGSFTGAVCAKQGLFEVADGSTLLIDEIGEMPGSLQAKLLRVLEDGSMRRVGSLQERRVDVRLLAATNRNMAEEVKAGRFREDLYYRINVMSLNLPPLRDRTGDVPLLVQRIVGSDWTVEPQAMAVLERYSWPGNVRQLINALERAKILADDFTVTQDDLPTEVVHAAQTNGRATPMAGDELATIQRGHIVEVLRRAKGNKARAAKALGINRRSLYRLIEKFEIQPADETDSLSP
ncbi:MAG: sigma-54 dependent transcriptional regulator [Planctomycetes bacterium]|nr:sigma-54 dependent transcriptional regulator [Planctomycetota bacterium]